MHDCKPVFVSKFNFLTISLQKKILILQTKDIHLWQPVSSVHHSPSSEALSKSHIFDLPRLERKAETEFHHQNRGSVEAASPDVGRGKLHIGSNNYF